MIDSTPFIGFSAGIFAIVGYLPQIYKSFLLKKMDEVSIWLIMLFMASSFLWTIYGIFKEDTILSGLSMVTLSLGTILINMKMIYEKKTFLKKSTSHLLINRWQALTTKNRIIDQRLP